jgi:hypothetical protein
MSPCSRPARLTRNPEAESNRLIACLGLDWEASCLDFLRSPYQVWTASWAQARQPLPHDPS